MNIGKGWCFHTADFSLQAAGHSETGGVMLVRDMANRAKWHKLPEELQESEDGPELYVSGEGETVEDAIDDANLSAARAKEVMG